MSCTGYEAKNNLQAKALEQYKNSLEELKGQYTSELFDIFSGNTTKRQMECIKTSEKTIQLKEFCEMFGINEIVVEGEKPKFLPEGKIFDKAGPMISELFTRLEEKNKELGVCSRWLKNLGFKQNVLSIKPLSFFFKSKSKYFFLLQYEFIIRDETTLNKAEEGIENEISRIYEGNDTTFDPRRGTSLVDTISFMLRTNSGTFVDTFKKIKSDDLGERMEKTKQKIARLFDLDKVTMKELKDLQKVASSVDNFASEINNV